MGQVDYRWVVWTEEHVKEHVKVNKLDPDVKCIVQHVVGSLQNRRKFLRILSENIYFNFFRAPPHTLDSSFALAGFRLCSPKIRKKLGFTSV